MAKTRSSNNSAKVERPNTSVCDCTDCLWARLVQYEGRREPLLAECTRKPQPYDTRFPYQVEVARAMKLCPTYSRTDAARTPEVRPKRHLAAAGNDNTGHRRTA